MHPSEHSLDVDEPPALDRARRSGTLSVAALRALAARFPSRMTPARKEVALGLLFLWHDHWEQAHEIAQSDEGEPDHDLLHALVHRREGDYSNAGYWFRRAGKARAYAALPDRVSGLLQGSPLAARVLAGDAWNATGFLECVRRNDQPEVLRALQAREFLAFHESLFS